MGEFSFHNAMKKSRRRIQRLKPDAVIALNAVANIDRSDVTTLPAEMAERLCSHWSAVFADKSVDGDLLDRWLDEEFPTTRPECDFLPCTTDSCWKLYMEHIEKAIRLSNDSAPGLDGIPYRAWRLCRQWT